MERRKLDNKCIISFLLASFCMLMVLWNMGVLWRGDNSLIEGDLMENYIPAIKALCRDIINRESIWYSWNIGMGMNTSLYNAYYAYNPFNILYLIFYNSYDNAVTIAIIVIKTGTSALCFHLFVSEAHGVKSPWAIVFSILYSMCAFQVSYNITNIIWLDAMFVLPVVFLGINRMISEGEYRLLLFGYTYIFVFQFYMGYMIGIISFIYLCINLINDAFDENKRLWKDNAIMYSKILFLAIGLAAFIWLPTVYFIMNNQPADASEFGSIELSLKELLKQLMWRNIVGSYTQLPNLYCGVLTMVLCPVFVLSSKVEKRDKVVYISLLIVMVSSCFIPWLYRLWHGFDAPDGWSYRFAYIISFLLCTIAAITASEFRVDRLLVSVVIILCAMTECITAYWNQPILQKRLSKLDYDLWNISEKENTYTLEQDTDFFRVNTMNNYSINPGIYYGYNGISYFSTAENPTVRDTLSKLGLYSSPRMLLNFGLTPVTEMLLGVRYNSYGALQVEGGGKQDLFSTIIENEKALGIGYMVAGTPTEYILDSKDAFENNNRLLSVMIGKDISVFEHISEDDIVREEYAVRVIDKNGEYEIETDHPDVRLDDAHLTYHVMCDDDLGQAYAYVENDASIKSEQGFIMQGGYENVVRSMGNVAVSYIKSLEREENGYRLTITPIGDVMYQPVKDILFCYLNKQQLDVAYNLLEQEQLHIMEHHDGYIKGTIMVKSSNRTLFTTIPYEEGWKAKVDEKEIDIQPILNNTFISIKMPSDGEHTVELTYKPKFADVGTAISVLCLGGVIIMEKKYSDKINKQERTDGELRCELKK